MISAVVLTKNEQDNIRACLKSLSWCDELIVIDDYSTDDTAAIAKKQGAKVFKRHLSANFSAQRNFGLKKATQPWVLFIDSDEQVSAKLAREILKTIKKTNFAAFSLYRRDHFLGRALKYGETARVNLVRLVKKSTGVWERPVHEIWTSDHQTSQLKNPLDHYPHPNLFQFLKDINFYSTIEANYQASISKPRLHIILIRLILFPPTKFVVNYIFKLGFLDGLPGLIIALFMSLHSLLVRVKLLPKRL